MKLLKVTIDLFEAIYIDEIYLYVGRDKVKINTSGLYNQTISILKLRKLHEQFIYWFYRTHDLDTNKEIPDEVIKDWESSLDINSKTMIYIKALRIMFKPNNIIEFYALKDGCILEYISNTSNPSFFKQIIQYLQYSPICDKLCEELKIEHALDKSDKLIREEIRSCLRYKLIPIVKSVKTLSNSKGSYCLAYYDINCGNENNPTPAWDNFLRQLNGEDKKECFKAWIYSIFKDDNFGRQVLWLYGRGNTGKSEIAEKIYAKLKSLNSTICSNLVDTWHLDKFSSSAYTNKRFIKAPDTRERALVRMQIIKNITGNDSVNVRRMGQEEIDEKIYAKLMVTSNSRPFVNTDKEEELSRILFIDIDSKKAFEAYHYWNTTTMGSWSHKLYEEIDDFIAKCKHSYYNRLMPDGQNIIMYNDMVEQIQLGDYFIRRDMIIWWDNCIMPYSGDKKTSVLTLSELVDDYSRFIAPNNNSGKYTRVIRSFLTTLVRSKEISIYDMEIGNNEFIEGYMFKEPRTSMKLMKQLIADNIETKGNTKNEIFK